MVIWMAVGVPKSMWRMGSRVGALGGCVGGIALGKVDAGASFAVDRNIMFWSPRVWIWLGNQNPSGSATSQNVVQFEVAELE